MEENRRFSWTDLFIKVILVIIFVLFTVWLLSLSNKGLSDSLDVLTNNIFSQNMEKMKEVGKEYFTIERLPEKVGDVKTLTLEKMYEKKLLLELTDKHGNACSAKNSYVSIEKYENEYQMKVFLECGEESDYIIVIMGCYDYCDTDICELDEEKEETTEIEYQYKKTTGGKWSDWGKWSEWSKVSVTETNYRDVETKVETEEYSYDKTVTEIKYAEVEATCPSGYQKTSDGTKCYKTNTTYKYENPTCPTLSSEWSEPSRTGFTCSYTKTVTYTENPTCPDRTSEGWTYTSRNGFTCNYSKEVVTSYQEEVTEKKTCYSQKVVKPCDACAPVIQNIPYDCSTTSYVTKYKTETETDTKTATCPSGYTKSGDLCKKNDTITDTKTATCPSGYTQSGNECKKTITNNVYEELVKTCPSGYNLTDNNSKCSKETSKTETITETREVKYYRYRIREYIGGTTDYKWSSSKNDTNLINAGYKLTGKTRVKGE